MMKKLLVRIYHGFSITMIVNSIVHFIVAQAMGTAVTPAFAARFAGEGAATVAQLVLVGMIGAAFAGAAMVFELERWSYLKQGVVHFLITAAVWIPVAYICWAPVRGIGLVWTIAGWTLTYAVNWLVQYFIWKKSVAELNRKISARRSDRA